MRRAPTYFFAYHFSLERVDPHEGAGVRRVDEQAVAEVDADVVERVEEDEVARLEL